MGGRLFGGGEIGGGRHGGCAVYGDLCIDKEAINQWLRRHQLEVPVSVELRQNKRKTIFVWNSAFI
eukprot:scaffold37617_cov128-Skeletonema_dohrnii-CCMP3373.AAC.2